MTSPSSIKQEMKSEKNKVIYTQRFRKEWKAHPVLKDWLREQSSDRSLAYCRYCRCSLKAKLWELINHAKTKKHLKSALSYGHVRENLEEYVRTSSRIGSKSNIKTERVSIHPSDAEAASLIGTMDASVSQDEEDLQLDQYAIETHPKLRDDLTEAQINCYQAETAYFTSMGDLSKIQKTLMVLEARKLQLEIERMRDE